MLLFACFSFCFDEFLIIFFPMERFLQFESNLVHGVIYYDQIFQESQKVLT